MYITKVIDAHCFWAFFDKNAMATIDKISAYLEEYVRFFIIRPTKTCSLLTKTLLHLTCHYLFKVKKDTMDTMLMR